MSRSVLLQDLALETFFGFDFGTLSMDAIRLGTEDYLAVTFERADSDRPTVICLPAAWRGQSDGTVVTIFGNDAAQLTTLVPAAHTGVEMEATYYVSSVEVVGNFPDARRDVLHVDFNKEGDTVEMDIWCRRLGPPSFGPFGRDTLYEQAPIHVTLRRSPSVMRASLWLATRP